MGKVYFIADTHFGSDSIIRYENRPFESVTMMDEEIIANWNRMVEYEDTVYVLGDFSAYDDETDRTILGRLNGNKILIMGNHDRHRSCDKWREIGFSECSSLPVIYNDFFMLSHEPLYVNNNMPYANIFGHVHANPAYRDASAHSLCVSVERINYTPIEFGEVLEKLKLNKI